MAKPTPKQLAVIAVIQLQCDYWSQSNDIHSPSHGTDIDSELVNLTIDDTISDAEQEALSEAVGNVWVKVAMLDACPNRLEQGQELRNRVKLKQWFRQNKALLDDSFAHKTFTHNLAVMSFSMGPDATPFADSFVPAGEYNVCVVGWDRKRKTYVWVQGLGTRVELDAADMGVADALRLRSEPSAGPSAISPSKTREDAATVPNAEAEQKVRLAPYAETAMPVLGYFRKYDTKWNVVEVDGNMLVGYDITSKGKLHTLHIHTSQVDEMVLLQP